MKQSIRVGILLVAAVLLSSAGTTSAQQTGKGDPVAKEAGVYCTGFISEVAPRVDLQIIGGEKENEVYMFNQGDVVYLNKGREDGVHSGAVYYVTRPLGEVKHPFTKKKVGYFSAELGMLQVIETHPKTSVARITVSCDTIELGDVLKPYELMTAPDKQLTGPLPRYSEGSSGLVGRIILSPDLKEYLSANQLAFIDLGNRQGVRPGDRFTIYRKITQHEGVANAPGDNIVEKRSSGYGSDRFKGGDFASNAARVSRDEVLDTRPALPRKVMGEMVILKVENTAAVGLITRTTAEVNVGDFVERAN